MKEYEYKCLITLDIFQSMKKNLSSKFRSNSKLQINYFFDTKTQTLHHRGITVRVRQQDSNLFLQAKIPIQSQTKHGARIKEEFSLPLNTFPLIIDRDTLDQLGLDQVMGDIEGPFYLQGALVTERTTFIVESEITIDLDKSNYLGITDYEIEVEFRPNQEAKAVELFKEITRESEYCKVNGKRNRFFKQLQQLYEVLENEA